MLTCWAIETSERPNFSKIVEWVSKMLTVASNYLSLDVPSDIEGEGPCHTEEQLGGEEGGVANPHP